MKTANRVEKMREAILVIVRAPNSQVSPKRHKMHHSFKTTTQFSPMFDDLEPFFESLVCCLRLQQTWRSCTNVMHTNMTAFITTRRKRGPMNAAKKTTGSLMKQLGIKKKERIKFSQTS